MSRNQYYRPFVLFLFLLFYGGAFAQKNAESSVLARISSLIDNARFEAADKTLDSLVSASVKNNNDQLLTKVYNLKGSICKEQEKMKEAIFFFLKSVEINSRLKNAQQLSINYINLGSIYSGLGETKSALNYYFKAIHLISDSKDQNKLAVLYNNIGNIYKAEGKRENSAYYFKKALSSAVNSGDSLTLAMVYHNIGSNMEEMGKYDQAIEQFQHSLRYLSGYDQGIGHIFNYEHLGFVYYKQKKIQEAEKFLLKAEKISKLTRIFGELGPVYKSLSEIYEERGLYKKSLEYDRLYSQKMDSLYKQNSKSEIARLQFEGDLFQQKQLQEQEQKSRDLINNTRLEAKNKIIIFSFIALSVVLVLVVLIFLGYRQKQKTNRTILKQKELVEQKNEEILSSINYAKRIQNALLTSDDLLGSGFNEICRAIRAENASSVPAVENGKNGDYFILFHPKDIVSGDFYWACVVNEKQNKGRKLFYFAVCDSTGHGVPGAFMSLLNTGYLSEAINEKSITEPNHIFNYVRRRLVESISKEQQKDGFDGTLLCFDVSGDRVAITYAGANNAPVIVRNGTATKLEADNMPVGIGERKQEFTLYTIDALPGDNLYLFTDGYADQFGGPAENHKEGTIGFGKKFKQKPLLELLTQVSSLSMEEQKEKLKKNFEDWKGGLEQVDDVCVLGIRI